MARLATFVLVLAILATGAAGARAAAPGRVPHVAPHTSDAQDAAASETGAAPHAGGFSAAFIRRMTVAPRPSAPAPAPVLPVPIVALPDVWRAELLFAVQPDQVNVDLPCRGGIDCPTRARSFAAGGLRGEFDRPGRWSGAVTLAVAHAEDQERQPPGGYGVVSLRVDVQVELGRAADRFGLALRASPVLMAGWSARGAAFRTDLPGFAVLLGGTDVWVEIDLPVLPTPADPRFFSIVVGWKQPLFTVEGGFATFSSLTYAHDALGRTGLGPGAWLAGRGRLAVDSPWEATLRLVLASSSSLVLGVGYRWGDLAP